MSATIIVCTTNTYTLELPRALFVNFYGSNFHKNGRLRDTFQRLYMIVGIQYPPCNEVQRGWQTSLSVGHYLPLDLFSVGLHVHAKKKKAAISNFTCCMLTPIEKLSIKLHIMYYPTNADSFDICSCLFSAWYGLV